MWYKKNNDDDLKENKKPKNERKEESSHAASRTNNYGYIIWELIVNVSFWIQSVFVLIISIELTNAEDLDV